LSWPRITRYLSKTTLQFVWVALRGRTSLQLVSCLPKRCEVMSLNCGLQHLPAALFSHRSSLGFVMIKRARVTGRGNNWMLRSLQTQTW